MGGNNIGNYELQLANYDDIFEIVSLYHRLVGTPGCTWTFDYPRKETAENDIKNDWIYTLKKNDKLVAFASVGDFDELSDLQWKPQKPIYNLRFSFVPLHSKACLFLLKITKAAGEQQSERGWNSKATPFQSN